jgi:hypothetical protein
VPSSSSTYRIADRHIYVHTMRCKTLTTGGDSCHGWGTLLQPDWPRCRKHSPPLALLQYPSPCAPPALPYCQQGRVLARCALPTVFWVLIGSSARRMIPRQTSAQWQPAQPNRVTNLNTVQSPPHRTVIPQIGPQAGVGKSLAIRLRGLSVPCAPSPPVRPKTRSHGTAQKQPSGQTQFHEERRKR